MNDLESLQAQVSSWLQPLPDVAAPCGPDLEYDNDFLALTQAAAGKPETQVGDSKREAVPPNWPLVAETAAGLFERTRDLRVAIYWLRATLCLFGYRALPLGLALVNGLLENHWEHLHPLPDPDDGDLYARANALAVLVDPQGLVGELREARMSDDRALGDLTMRAVEVALDLSPVRAGETEFSRDSLTRMLGAALASAPDLRAQCSEVASRVAQLVALVADKLAGSPQAPDLRPLASWVAGVVALLPPEPGAAEAGADEPGTEGGAAGGGAARRGLAGTVASRDEAIRAIDMVCEYLERAEPTNPAPLFLRRARHLISHNFLQLMKVLAPDALAEVARVVGVDPDTVEDPGGS